MTKQDPKTVEAPTKNDSIPDNAVEKEKPRWTPEELLIVFDEMIFSGEYEEEISIRGKLKVAFRARSAEDTSNISREIDGKNYTLISTLQEQRALLNLSYSLISYAGKNLKGVSVDERRKIVAKLPAVMVATLSDALFKFDQKIAAACEEGESNF